MRPQRPGMSFPYESLKIQITNIKIPAKDAQLIQVHIKLLIYTCIHAVKC